MARSAHDASDARSPGLETAAAGSLFRPGHNCYRVARAHRVALLVDADAYFKAFAAAALRATRSILVVAWDFHSRTRLHHGIPDAPDLLGDFLNFLARRRPGLEVRVLIWDYPVIFAKGREISPVYGLGWRPHRHVHVHYDDCFPIGAALHQKLVIIDGALAFCGGLDLTRSRWDTPEHLPADPRRVDDDGEEPYPPFHDVMMAVDGDAARVLESIVLERWLDATGQYVAPASTVSDPWPASLPAAVTDVEVAVARTLPAWNGRPAVAEVEALYVDMIAAAKRLIYIENQYFTSSVLGDALARRLAEPDGPEIIAVLRLSTDGWLEAPTMGTLRTELLRRLREADRYGRMHAYYPYISGLPEGQCCDLHSKLIIVDDDWLQIGSANFCNRSMGLDVECNLALESHGEERVAAAIAGLRERLLAEHLGVSPEAVRDAARSHDSVSGLICALGTEHRRLVPYENLEEPSEAMLAIAGIADPEHPVSLDRLMGQFAPEAHSVTVGPRWPILAAIALAAALLAALWRYTPIVAWTDAERIVGWAGDLARRPWLGPAVVLAYTPAAFLLFPRPLITLFAVAAFGPWIGFAYAWTGILLAALVSYYVGRSVSRSTVRRIAGARINRLTRLMSRRGWLTMTAVRLVPLAPFVVVNLVAGAIRFRPWHFLLGSALGILPGTLAATVLGDQLLAGLRDPRSMDLGLLIAVLAGLAAAAWVVQRWVLNPQANARPEGHGRTSRA